MLNSCRHCSKAASLSQSGPACSSRSRPGASARAPCCPSRAPRSARSSWIPRASHHTESRLGPTAPGRWASGPLSLRSPWAARAGTTPRRARHCPRPRVRNRSSSKIIRLSCTSCTALGSTRALPGPATTPLKLPPRPVPGASARSPWASRPLPATLVHEGSGVRPSPALRLKLPPASEPPPLRCSRWYSSPGSLRGPQCGCPRFSRYQLQLAYHVLAQLVRHAHAVCRLCSPKPTQSVLHKPFTPLVPGLPANPVLPHSSPKFGGSAPSSQTRSIGPSLGLPVQACSLLRCPSHGHCVTHVLNLHCHPCIEPGPQSLVTGHWSLVTGHWSLVTGHWVGENPMANSAWRQQLTTPSNDES